MTAAIQVTVWNEARHENQDSAVRAVYPDGMHMALAGHLGAQDGLRVRTATLDEPEHGLTEAVLAATDVLIWWGHLAHHEVADAIVDRVQRRVLDGMGLIVLHSGHLSKIFVRLMGTSCMLRWREASEKERLWVVNPCHPITRGIGPYIELPATETYGEFFDIPEPDKLLFMSWFQGGDVFRSGAVWTRGKGKIFYFRPGHETFPQFYHPQVLRVIRNAVFWAGFDGNADVHVTGDAVEALEPPPERD